MAITDTTTTSYTDDEWHLVDTGVNVGDEVSVVASQPVYYAFSAAEPAPSVLGIPRSPGVEMNCILDTGDDLWVRCQQPDGGYFVSVTIKRAA